VTLRVLVVDDQELVRSGFSLVLAGQDGSRSWARRPTGSPPSSKRGGSSRTCPDGCADASQDGIAATRQLVRDAQPGEFRTKVLILTTFDLDDYVYDALRAGASGFLLKGCADE